jgi:tetratricopeptide (TPR) repeat protein
MADKAAIIREAQKYLAKGQIDKAISEWEKLISESPDGNTYNMIGDLYLRKGDKKGAAESFHKAANYFRREGFSLKALALYKKVLNVNTGDADALYALGELSEEKGLATDAIKYYLATADSLSKEGKKDRILDIYQKILSLSPSNIPLRNKVAETFLKEGLNADAAKEYFHIAKLYEDKGDIVKAAEYYEKVLGILPMHKKAAMGLGYLYEKSGKMEDAVALMKEAASLFPEDPDVLFRCAELSSMANDHKTAKDYLLKVAGIEPKHIKARRLLGEIYFKQGEEEKAWEEYLPVIDEIILQENLEDSVRLLESFKKTDPIQTGKRLVLLYRQLREDDKIVSELTSLGDSLKESGMIEEAIASYRDALDINANDVRLREMVEELSGQPEEKEGPKAGEESVTERLGEGEKTAEELFMEADVFSRYGLLSEAIKILEGLKPRMPQNLDLHLRLKTLYAETWDKESLVTECIILHELYKRQGDTTSSEKMLVDAFEINPEDPRLAERGLSGPRIEPTSYAREDIKEFDEGGAGEYEIEDYEEDIAEADFYVRQGLTQEAVKILERLHRLFPQNEDIAGRLSNLGHFPEAEDVQMPSFKDLGEQPFGDSAAGELPDVTLPDVEGPAREEPVSAEAPPTESVFQQSTIDEFIPQEPVSQRPPVGAAGSVEEREKVSQPAEETEYEDFSFTDQDLVDAQEMPEPELDSDVLEIFQEFKKGLEGELGDEDSETHYNLGIAYKEMGLIDDAIKEFQTSKNDPKRFMQSSTMLGVCYVEKGLFSLAIDVLTKVMEEVSDKDESYWAIKYDLADAYEKNNNLKEALDLYTEVFGWNARFRSVSEKMSKLKTRFMKGSEGEKPKTKKDRVSYL